MRRWSTCIGTLIVISTVHAESPDYPATETLYPLQGDIGSSVLHMNCSLRDADTLDCETLQIMFTKPKVEEQITDAYVDAFVHDMNEHICQEVSWDEALNNPSISKKLAELDTSQADKAEHFIQLCTEDTDTRRQIVQEIFTEAAQIYRKTCGMMIFPTRSQRFTWDSLAEQWRSVTDGDACGAVTVTTLKSDDGTFWNYTTRTIVTAPHSKSPHPSLSCKDYADEEPLIWSGKGNSIRQNCQIVGESWTR